ncbi:hypothetical protein 2 [Wuhan insect virus 27]|uniref:RNA-directed RNA polymerase n=1 Tax=Wuhan insect virus 27 TaxID=1923731 RepID=A0A1L3KF60_9VIRU|nr:hypothetical protein 2 [Wuhan insect virus 27]APG76058.1 hypothetical protein 2 [Wuhan insect virus 27]
MTVEPTEERSVFRDYRFRDGAVPTGIRISGGGSLEAAPFSDADFVLVDRIRGKFNQGPVVIDVLNTSAAGFAVPGPGYTFLYMRVNQELVPVNPQVMALAARHFMGDFNVYYNDLSDLKNVRLVLGESDNKIRNNATLQALPKPKISGSHHIHFTAAEVWGVLTDQEKERAMQYRRLGCDLTTSFVAGVMIWLVSLNPELYELVAASDLLDSMTVKEFAKKAKRLSVQAKSLQNVVTQDLRVLFEADVLVNRVTGEVDWAGEKEHRTKCNLAQISPQRVKEVATRLFNENNALGERPRRFEWKKFWNNRWQWSAAGSIHSQYSEDMQFVSKQRELKNKFIALITMPDMPIEYFLERKPEIRAWSSIKYEWGKLRAIYGTDLTSYVLSHFAFYNCEDVLPAHFPVGKKARPSYVRSRIRSILSGSIPFCIDFEDFNSQHSNESMIAVIEAYLEVYQESFSKEQIMALQWTIQSIKETHVIDNMGTKTEYQTKGTLMSGWRLTTFVNSVLNYVYTRELIGESKTVTRSVHNGDDVLVGITNLAVARDVVRNARKYNVRLQTVKSNLGSIAEFLRVDHARGEYGQYLTRNIATLVHSRIESQKAVSLIDLIEAMEDRFGEFFTRGGSMDLITRLRDKYYQHVAPIYNATVEIAYKIKQAHKVVGGASRLADASINYIIKQAKTVSEVELPKKLPGLDSYADELIASLGLSRHRKKVRERVQQATLNAVQLVRKAISVVSNVDMKRSRVLRALYKSYADVADSPMFGKAKMTGFVIDVLANSTKLRTLSMKLRGSQDPIALLSVIT